MARTVKKTTLLLIISLLFPLVNLSLTVPYLPTLRRMGYDPALGTIYAYILILWLFLAGSLILAKKLKLKIPVMKKHRHKLIFFVSLIGICFGILFYGEVQATPSLALLVLFVAAAVVEEYYFRGMLMSYFSRYGNLIQAALFSLMHLRFAPLMLIAYFVFGLAMGYLRKNGVLYPIIAHGLANLTQFLLLSITFV
ncbi:MAG: CPBP family intramembrane glutamic endopeptidase [Nanobdellota archaeon]